MKTSQPAAARQSGRIGGLFRTVAGFAGILHLLGAGAAADAAAPRDLGYRTPDSVPVSWMRYAQLVQYRFRDWLSGDDPIAHRFHLYLENRVVAAAAPPETLVVRVWIDPAGKVTRVDFAPLDDKQADADLRALLSSGNIGEPPPPDLLQPLHLRVSLKMPE